MQDSRDIICERLERRDTVADKANATFGCALGSILTMAYGILHLVSQ
eukprot:CAMPEP_0169281902 /NCGR_PEP_ID=MMETSP1016-20121227/56566_1 /TAXON_ID=342587 /ORGANISM="Karlodinium micrum, Strain CCMP2283" /LENGTH=46 /DNA_ID= /DNA_START= /DNA_END= /DNA_ORIENTATION=